MTTAESGEEYVDAPEEKQLFRFGTLEARTRSLSHTLLLLTGAFLFGVVLSSTARGTLESVGYTEETAPLIWNLLPMSFHFLGLIAAVWIYVDRENARSLLRMRTPTRWEVGWILVGMIGLVIALTGTQSILAEFGHEPAENSAVEAGKENPSLFLYFVPVVVLLNAPAEELLFRGVIQGLFRRAYGVIPAILAAGAVFGLIHYVALVGSGSRFAYVTIALVSGLVLGSLYEYTDNLSVPIAVHACWNILVYLNLYIEYAGVAA